MACNQESIKHYINLSGNEDLIKELGHEDADFVSKEVHYHIQCKKDFIRQVEKKQKECHVTPTEEASSKSYENYPDSGGSGSERILSQAAEILRTTLLGVRSSCDPLPNALTSRHFSEGQAPIPEIVSNFILSVISSHPTKPSNMEIRVAKSLASDLLYNTTKGHVKPAKHLCLGVGIKSLTGSEKVCDILHKLGHAISTTQEKGIMTEIAEEISRKRFATPDGLYKEPHLATVVSWDNYDELTDSINSSLQATHDTQGVAFQNIKPAGCPRPPELAATATEQVQQKRRKRSYGGTPVEIAPYRRVPQASRFNFSKYEAIEPDSLKEASFLDNLWLFISHLHPMTTPMWKGWNSSVALDHLPTQTLGYMENIEHPPTRLDVVNHTLITSEKIRMECQQQYMLVGYDLAVAKPAMRIQEQESPKFDKLFIELGPFHLRMAYFGCIGYFITSSGMEDIICTSDVLGSGSLQGFLSGKHFNRCDRIHPLMFAALSELHIQRFLNDTYQGSIPDAIQCMISSAKDHPTEVDYPVQLQSFLICYEQYCELTRKGAHGKTAQFAMIYMDMVHDDLLLDRALRINDVELYTYAVGRMLPVLWAANRPNYKRWGIKAFLQLLNREDSHPGISDYFNNGALSVRRTDKNFARSAHDITLEQTANRDAASRKTGITAFTTNPGGRKRWSVTRSARSMVVSTLCDMADIYKKEDVAQECRTARIKKDREDVVMLTMTLLNTLNPFSPELNPQELYCISTGVALKPEVTEELIHLRATGESWMKTFIEECKQNPTRFEQPIKQKKVSNFAVDSMKVKVRSKDLKILELTFSRDLFAQILLLSQEQSISMEHILSFPLTPAPLSLAHINGTMCSTNKAALVHKLEAQAEMLEDASCDVLIIDFMFLLRAEAAHLPQKYGDIARYLLAKVRAYGASTIFMVADIYSDQPSIKDCCREKRGRLLDDRTFSKSLARGQTRPGDFANTLRSDSFKQALFNFLIKEWTSCVDIVDGCVISFAVDHCYTYQLQEDGLVSCNQIREYQCFGHQEADTMMVHYALCASQPGRQLLVRSDDSDVFFLLLHHAHRLSPIKMDLGLSSRNNRRCVNITQLADDLGEKTCSALPAFHLFTGSDYTAAFTRKGKSRPFEMMTKDDDTAQAFAEIGKSETVSVHCKRILEKFTCKMYGRKLESKVNVARHKMLTSRLPKSGSALKKLKHFDPATLPPCLKCLDQKMKRVNFVAHIYKNAHSQTLNIWDACQHGWKLVDGHLTPLWFEGEQLPSELYYEEDKDTDDYNSESESDNSDNSDSDEDIGDTGNNY